MSKQSYEGVLERVDLGPGGWRLRLEGGGTVDLYGEVPSRLEGSAVRVTGRPADAGMLMGGGQAVEVSRIQKR